MNTKVTYKIDCPDAESTEALAERLGRMLRGGEVIELAGDVGAGKTTFVRGLAKGVDSPDHVSSPTFTVSAIYAGRLKVHHLDLYRLDDPGLVRLQLEELLEEPKSVIVIEWGNSVAGVLPGDRVTIRFRVGASEVRCLEVEVPKGMEYIKC